MRRYLIAASAGLLAASAAATSPAVAQTKILLNNFVPRAHPITTGILQPWAARVAKATEGRVTVEFPAATLAPPPRQWSMVTKGIADAGFLFNAFERRRLKLVQMYHLPFISPNGEAAGVAMNRVQTKYFNAADEYKGIKLLGQFSFVGNNIFTAKKQINSVEDLKNLKMRTAPGMGKEVFSTLGAVVVTTPGAKAFAVVSKGIVDGLAHSFADLAAFKMMPYIKYATMVEGKVYNSGFSLLINEKKWNGLAKRDRDAITAVSWEQVGRDSRAWDERDRAARAEFEKKGGIVRQASPAMMKDLKARLAYLEQKWLDSVADSGIDAKAALAYYRAEALKVAAAAK
jgi:TRAP-type C4-dicarboxylate transport system substrate-binding protein